jgi:prevent-host-death family protein
MTMVMKKVISAGQFKARCLALMDQVQAQRMELIITKRGKPVARLVPIEKAPKSIFGSMAGTFEITGDIVAPAVDPADWEASR